MGIMNRSAVPFVVIGIAGIVVAGAVSAASASAPSYTSSWAVAYLVLVVGVSQLALGLGQSRLAAVQPSRRVVAAEAVTFNAANIAVLVGTIMVWPVLTDVGGALFIGALALFVWGVRTACTRERWLLYGFRAVIVVLIVTTPIGLVIAALRAS